MGRFDIFPIFIATFASRRVTLIATHSKSQKQTRLPIRYLYFILPFKPLINKEVIKVFQNYKNNLVLSFWQGKIRALLHEIADTMRTRKKKNPLRVSSNGIFCAQDRNRTCTPCGTRT